MTGLVFSQSNLGSILLENPGSQCATHMGPRVTPLVGNGAGVVIHHSHQSLTGGLVPGRVSSLALKSRVRVQWVPQPEGDPRQRDAGAGHPCRPCNTKAPGAPRAPAPGNWLEVPHKQQLTDHTPPMGVPEWTRAKCILLRHW